MRFTAYALVALLLAAPEAAAQKETENVDRTIPMAAGGTLELKNFSGDVKITGTAGSNVVIHATRRATRERLDNIKLDISVSGSTVKIEANKRNSDWHEKNENVVETAFDIQVPAGTRLDVNAFSSELTIADTTGPIQAQTFSGGIHIDLTRAGELPEVTAETFSGDIKARVADGRSGRVVFNTFSGDLRSDLPLILHEGSRRSMTGDLGSGGGASLRFKTFSGDVRVVR